MANPLYGQNKFDDDVDIYGRGKDNVIITTAAHTLLAEDSGSTILHNIADAALTLPPAAAGLKFKVILGIESTSGCNILTATAADCFFGVIPISCDDTDDQTGVAQKLTYAVSIAAPASYDAMKFVAATATIGGVAGTTIWLNAVSGVAWHVAIPYHATSANDPGDCALIVAR
jgi:Mg2+/citrate symporter